MSSRQEKHVSLHDWILSKAKAICTTFSMTTGIHPKKACKKCEEYAAAFREMYARGREDEKALTLGICKCKSQRLFSGGYGIPKICLDCNGVIRENQ